jgi:hypothetical protein
LPTEYSSATCFGDLSPWFIFKCFSLSLFFIHSRFSRKIYSRIVICFSSETSLACYFPCSNPLAFSRF